MAVSGGGDGASIATSFSAPAPAYVPKREDLDALVALLADERPSRFWDFNGPRTVGDNAWRAVAKLLEADPRKLAGQPTEKAWTRRNANRPRRPSSAGGRTTARITSRRSDAGRLKLSDRPGLPGRSLGFRDWFGS
jgi:hypothetical protein